jgi:hypothetical protein
MVCCEQKREWKQKVVSNEINNSIRARQPEKLGLPQLRNGAPAKSRKKRSQLNPKKCLVHA